MWRWMKRWADWLRNDRIPLFRARRGGHTVRLSYDLAGQVHTHLPVPWVAESVTLEVTLVVPPALRRKIDFTLRLPHSEPIPAEAVRPDADDRCRISFCCPVPIDTTTGELLWKHRPVGTATIPVLTAGVFFAGLSLALPTVSVRLSGQTAALASGGCEPPGGVQLHRGVDTPRSPKPTAGAVQTVPVQRFAAVGSHGLIATTVLRAAHCLAPVAELGVNVVFRNERTGQCFTVPVLLTAEQRAATEALVTAMCPRIPRRTGWWSVTWRIGEFELGTRRVEIIPASRFHGSVRVAENRYAVVDKTGTPRITRQPPPLGSAERVGPCFLLMSTEPGAAGVCRLSVFTTAPGEPNLTLWATQDVVVTDAPTVFTPGLLEVAEMGRVSGFELRLDGRVIATASLSPVPPATLTAEGGFKPPPEFTWSAAAEEELQERLGRLM